MILIVDKNQAQNLAYGLSNDEFACQCSHDFCRATIATQGLLNAYDKFRRMIGVPMHILSGYRCAAHNKDVGGVALSRHTSGEALDIALVSMPHLSNEEIEHAAKMSGFNFVLFYNDKGFVHLDVR